MDCSLLGSSVRGILQARILKWVAILLSGDLPNLGMECWHQRGRASSFPPFPAPTPTPMVPVPLCEGSQHGKRNAISCIAGRFFTREAGDLNHIEFSYLLNGSHSFWREDLKDDFPKRNEERKALECFSEFVIQKFKYSPMILRPKWINQTMAWV